MTMIGELGVSVGRKLKGDQTGCSKVWKKVASALEEKNKAC
jgi:hypothetical protein